MFTIANNATLTNALGYPRVPNLAGVTVVGKQVRDLVAPNDVHQVAMHIHIVSATFGTANLQPQYSLDGVNWANLGSALSAAGITALTAIPKEAFFRLLVGGTGDVTAATVLIA